MLLPSLNLREASRTKCNGIAQIITKVHDYARGVYDFFTVVMQLSADIPIAHCSVIVV